MLFVNYKLLMVRESGAGVLERFSKLFALT